MAINVVKRNGTIQPFDQAKVKRSIEAACKDAGLSFDRTNELINQVLPVALEAAAGKEEIASAQITDVILRELDNVEPASADAWRKHDQAKGIVV